MSPKNEFIMPADQIISPITTGFIDCVNINYAPED